MSEKNPASPLQSSADQIELNEVDQRIKQMMLNYPTLYKSRFSALVHLFLTNGTGMEWKGGRLVPWHPEERQQSTMRYDDLLERIEKNEADLREDVGFIRHLFLSRRVALKREMAVRRMIEEDIDIYATEYVMGENTQYHAQWLKNHDPEWCVLSVKNTYGHKFPEYMEKAWADAALEIVEIAIGALWRDMGMYSEHFREEQVDPRQLAKYRGYLAIKEELDKFTGWKERAERTRALLDELREEAAERVSPRG